MMKMTMTEDENGDNQLALCSSECQVLGKIDLLVQTVTKDSKAEV
jgi:hypothetical protein